MFGIIYKASIAFTVCGLSQIVLSQVPIPVIDQSVAAQVGSLSGIVQSNGQTLSDAIKAVGTQISGSLQQQNAVQGNINEVIARAMVDIEKEKATLEIKRANAELYDPSMGAKARSSCAVYKAAASQRTGNQGRKAVLQQLRNLSKLHLERAVFREAGTDGDAVDSSRVIQQMDRVKAVERADPTGKILNVFSTGPVTTEVADGGTVEYEALVTKMVNLAIPKPVEVDPGYDRPGQSVAEAKRNAPKVIKLERQKMITEILDSHAADRVAVYDTTWVNDYLSHSSGGADGEGATSAVAGIGTQTNRLTAMKILNKHRINDEQWLLHTTGVANEAGLARDNNLMMAQILSTMQDQYEETRQVKLIMTYLYALALENSSDLGGATGLE